MDAYVFVAFFFPIIVMYNFLMMIGAFFFALWVGFGENLANVVDQKFDNLPVWVGTWLRDPPFNRYPSFYPLAFNICATWAVVSTYSLGYAFHSKGGWKWFQPGQGGIRFVLFQIHTWLCFSCCLIFPWMSVDDMGVLQWLQQVSPASEDKASYGGLLVMSSVWGILALTFALCGLLSYDANAKKIHRLSFIDDIVDSTRELESGPWNFARVFGTSETFWWMFVALEICVTFYSFAIALLIDYRFLENQTIQGLALVVYIGFLSTSIGLTNSIGGKWRHGEQAYRIFMPFQGGKLFTILQGVTWTSFALAIAFALWKLYNVLTIASSNVGGLMRLSGFLGLLSEILLVVSLCLFDPTQVDQDDNEMHEEETSSQRASSRSSRRGQTQSRSRSKSNSARRRKKAEEHVVDRIIGKRPSPQSKGTIEYLVQWRAPYGIRWENQLALLEKTGNARDFVLQLIDAYEQQLSQMVNESLSKEKTGSPGKCRSRGQQPQSSTQLSASKHNSQTNGGVNEIWEEYEDELGNTFYFSVTTGASVSELPTGYSYVQ